MSDYRTPSLLEPASRGGETAELGFTFQEGVLLAYLPYWLSHDGFSGLIRESVGDTEVAIFTPGRGILREFLEVKDYRLTPAPFWEEVYRFIEVDAGSPDTFQWFRLVAQDVSQELKPLLNGLRRVRSPYAFYEPSSGIVRNSIADYKDVVLGLGQNEAVAEFLFTRVLIDTTPAMAHAQGFGLFVGNMTEALPAFNNLPAHIHQSIYEALRRCVRPVNTPISRLTIEAAINKAIPEGLHPFIPVRLHTATQEVLNRTELVLDWAAFSGSRNRHYPEPAVWESHVVGELLEVKEFILRTRTHRHVCVTGTRRLSASLALGHVFSATGGFVLEMQYREEQWWKTNDHAGRNDAVQLTVTGPDGRGEQLFVSIGIPHDIGAAVHQYISGQGAADLPFLNIVFAQPITSVREANAIIEQVKLELLNALAVTGAKEIHLFCAVPAFIALLLGHRLNATATIQCYEFVGPNDYVPTCTLHP